MIHEEDIAANRRDRANWGALLGERGAVLTHCNAGALATGGYGTRWGSSGGAMRRTGGAGLCDETRPWLQGARLTPGTGTGWNSGDVAGRWGGGSVDEPERSALGDRGRGPNRRNGDVANKIGTYGLAVAARHHGVQFMVVAPAPRWI